MTISNHSSLLDKLLDYSNKNYKPFYTLLEITKSCNLSCQHCYSVQDITREELSFERISKLFKEIKKIGGLFLTITGGEPTTRKDFIQILEEGHKQGYALQIFTNGQNQDALDIARLKDLNIYFIGISIYGSDAKTHDKITKKTNSFVKSMNTAKMLIKSGITVVLKFVVMKHNVHQYKQVKEMAKKIGAGFQVDPTITAREDRNKGPHILKIDDKEMEFVLEDMKDYLFKRENKFPEQNELRCGCAQSLCAISAYGDIYPCIQMPISAGNINEKSFSEIWLNSELFQKLRSFEASEVKNCSHCELFSYCNRCPGMAIIEDGNLFGISSEACRQASIVKKILET